MIDFGSHLETMEQNELRTHLRRGVSRMTLIGFLLASSLLLLGCPRANNKTADGDSSPSTPVPRKSDFDGDKAFEYVRKQVEFGPRPPGSPELEKTRAYIIDQLRSFGLNVTTEEFRTTTPVGEVKMANIIAELPGESNDVVILASH